MIPRPTAPRCSGNFGRESQLSSTPDALEACVSQHRELPPVTEIVYGAFVDPSGGSRDAFALAIAHRDGERVIVDVIRAWQAPFNPTGVVEEASALLKASRCRSVTGDRYAGEWPREAFRAHGIIYTVSALDRLGLYLEMLPRVNACTVELPKDPVLLQELRGLERRRGGAGDRIDHRPGSHDDRANAIAGVLSAIGRRRPPGDFGITV